MLRGYSSGARDCAFSPDSTLLATGSMDGALICGDSLTALRQQFQPATRAGCETVRSPGMGLCSPRQVKTAPHNYGDCPTYAEER